MASINVINILVLDPKTKFTNQFKFEIVFECLSELKEVKVEIIFCSIKIGSNSSILISI